MDSGADSIDLQISFSYSRSLYLKGRTVVEGGSPAALRFAVSIAGSSPLANGPVRHTHNVNADGTFQTPLPVGEYRLTISAIPAGYYLQSMTAGSFDLLQSLLKLEDDTDPPEIVMTLGRLPSRGVSQ